MTLNDLLSLANLVLAAAVAVAVAGVGYRIVVRFLRARLLVADVIGPDGKSSASLTGVVRSELYRLQEEGAGAGLSFVTGNDKDIDLPADIELPKELGWITSLANFFPGRITTLSATTHGPSSRGHGITVAIQASDTRLSSIATLWEHDFFKDGDEEADPAERLHRMALIAAAWGMYRLIERVGVEDRLRLITQDWESYALFLIGSRLHQQGRIADARAVYAKALDRDAHNRGALFNLGVLDLIELDHSSAIQRLSSVVEQLETSIIELASPHRLDRLWYRAMYNRAAAKWHGFLEEGQDFGLASATVDSATVAAAAEETIEILGGEMQMLLGGSHADLVRFLVVVRNGAIALYADAAAAN